MLILRKVAITGGLSCGKSSVCRFLKELGAHVVLADEIVHQLLSPNTNLGKDVINLLGPNIVVNGQIDRSLIAKKVFNNPGLLESLEKLLHPAVFQEIEKIYQKVKTTNKASLFVAEIPLLFEVHGETFFDDTVAVVADPSTCKQRFMQSTGYDADEFDKRMARQLPPDEKAKRADYVIQNLDSLNTLKEAVQKLYNQLTTKR